MRTVKKAAIAAALCALIVGLLGCRDKTESLIPEPPNVYTPVLYLDKETGCEYLAQGHGFLPRISADGHTHKGCGGAK